MVDILEIRDRLKAEELKKLQKETESPDFWSDPKRAQRVTQRISRLSNDVEAWNELESKLTDAEVMAELLEEVGS